MLSSVNVMPIGSLRPNRWFGCEKTILREYKKLPGRLHLVVPRVSQTTHAVGSFEPCQISIFLNIHDFLSQKHWPTSGSFPSFTSPRGHSKSIALLHTALASSVFLRPRNASSVSSSAPSLPALSHTRSKLGSGFVIGVGPPSDRFATSRLATRLPATTRRGRGGSAPRRSRAGNTASGMRCVWGSRRLAGISTPTCRRRPRGGCHNFHVLGSATARRLAACTTKATRQRQEDT